MDKKIVYLIIAIVVIALAAWFWMKQPAPSVPVSAPVSGVQGTDSTSAINQEINSVTVQSPDFNAIDQDLNTL